MFLTKASLKITIETEEVWKRVMTALPTMASLEMAKCTERDVALWSMAQFTKDLGNEGENAQGQLCYRHLVTVLEIGCARSAHENQVLLNYDQFKAAKHNTWISNRSSLLEHATAERRKERLVFNAMYEKVRENKFPRAQRKRK
jgi:hypothetical protein